MSSAGDTALLVGDQAKALIREASRIEFRAHALLAGLGQLRSAVVDASSLLRSDEATRDGFDSTTAGVVRVEIDPTNVHSLELLGALSHLEIVLRETSQITSIAQRLSSEIPTAVRAASASRGKVRFFFAGGKAKEKALSSLTSLQQLLAWSATNGIVEQLGHAAERCRAQPWDGRTLWSDFQSRSDSYYAELAAVMGAHPAQADDGPFVDGDIVRGAVALARLAPRLFRATDEARSRVGPAFLLLRNQMVRRDLAQIPIARLKDATGGRLRFGVIESAGFATVMDILNTSIPVLQAINGVGPQTAMQVHAAALQVATALRVRVG